MPQCPCMTPNTGPGAETQPYIPVYYTCAGQSGNAVIPLSHANCCEGVTMNSQAVCDHDCLDSDNPCIEDNYVTPTTNDTPAAIEPHTVDSTDNDITMVGGGSGFETPQGGSDRLEKFNKMQMRESKPMNNLISENKICRCHGQTHYGHYGPIMCNTADHGVQAWWAEDCCNKTMDTPEGCWVTSNTGGPGNGGPGNGGHTKDEVLGSKDNSDRLEKFNKMQMRESKTKVTLTETELIDYINKSVLNEQGFGFSCEPSPGSPTGPCGCVPVGIIPPGGQTYSTIQDCQQDQNNCCYSGGQPQWWCIGGVAGMSCIPSPNPPGPNASGPFQSQGQCQNLCNPPQTFGCVNGQCMVQPGGQFNTLADCQMMCSTPLTWKCKNKGNHPKFGKHCVQVPSGGDFATKQECQASKGCAQLHKGYQVDMDIDVLNKKGSIVDYESDGSSTSSYGKETTNLRESELRRLVKRVIKTYL